MVSYSISLFDERKGSLERAPHTAKVLPPKTGASNTGFGIASIGIGARRRRKNAEPAPRRRPRARDVGGPQARHEQDLAVGGSQHRQARAQPARDLRVDQ